MSVSLFGDRAHSPILLCPCGALSAFHPRGEVEVARAVHTRGHIMTLSNAASQPIEDVVAARGGPVWFQLYRDPDWSRTLAMIKRAEAAGSPVLAWTIDSQGGGKRIVHARARRRDRAFCGTCHTLNPDDRGLALPGFLGSTINPDGKPMTTTPPLGPPRLDGRIATWDYVKRLKDATSMKVVLKGIVTREDAELALEYGADGIWVSNHGGRMENSLRSSVECVPEVAAGVAGRAPIIVDGGFRRGTDIFKALALGATAVGVGRPYIFGLAAFGQPGVETALDILDNELRMVMRQAGTPSLGRITKSYVRDRRMPPGRSGGTLDGQSGNVARRDGGHRAELDRPEASGTLCSSVEMDPFVPLGTGAAAAPTSSRRWPSARRPWASGAPTSSASPRSGSPASRRRSTFWTASCGW